MELMILVPLALRQAVPTWNPASRARMLVEAGRLYMTGGRLLSRSKPLDLRHRTGAQATDRPRNPRASRLWGPGPYSVKVALGIPGSR